MKDYCRTCGKPAKKGTKYCRPHTKCVKGPQKSSKLFLRKKGESTKQYYYRYMRSKVWASKRKKALTYYGSKCTVCNSTYGLEVHHLKYPKVLGKEGIQDLEVLCYDCHTDKHEGHPLRKLSPLDERFQSLVKSF